MTPIVSIGLPPNLDDLDHRNFPKIHLVLFSLFGFANSSLNDNFRLQLIPFHVTLPPLPPLKLPGYTTKVAFTLKYSIGINWPVPIIEVDATLLVVISPQIILVI